MGRDRFPIYVMLAAMVAVVASVAVSASIQPGVDDDPVTVEDVRVDLPDGAVWVCDVTYGDAIEFSSCERSVG